MRELIGREISLVAGGDLIVGFDPESRMQTVTVTGRRVQSFADEMAMRGIFDLNELVYGPNGQPPLGAPDTAGFAFIIDPNASDAAWDALGATQGLDGDLLQSIWENSQPAIGTVIEEAPGPVYPSIETWETFMDLFPYMPPNWRDWPGGPGREHDQIQ